MKLPAYPEYRKTEVEWLGELPAHWRVTRCRGLYRERKEFSDSGEEQLLSVSEYYGVRPRSEIIEEGDFLTRADTLEGYRKCYKRDLVMNYMLAWKSGLGCTEYDGIVSPAYAVFALRNVEFHYRYFHYLLRTPAAATEFKRFSSGIIDSRLRLYPATFLGSIFAGVPPPDEQRAITDFLDRETVRLDTLVAKKREVIERLKEKRTALISRIVTRGLNSSVKLKTSGIEWLSDIPEHWVLSKLGIATDEIGDGLHGTPDYVDDSGIYFVNGNNLVAGIVTFFENTRQVSSETRSRYRLPLSDTTVLMSINGTIGNLALYNGEKIMLGKSAAFINCGAALDRRFLAKYLASAGVRQFFDLELTGTTIFNLSLESIRRTPLALPALQEQRAIADYLDRETAKIDKMMEKVEAAIEKLQEYRTALITAAVTGKIDVRRTAT